MLMANIYINKIEKKIKTYNFALGDIDNQKLYFELSNSNLGDHRIIKEKNDGLFHENKRTKIEVPSRKLDNFINIKNPNQTLFFIYTQGYEGFVLSGAKKSLKNNPPIVLLFCPYTMKRASSLELAITTLISLNYKHYYILNNCNNKKNELNKDSISSLCQNLGYSGNFADLLII